MNPANDLAPLTVLLLSDDPALLADEAGGRVPTLTWCYNTITDADRWARPGPGMRPHEGVHAAIGLVLVLDGAPVAMSCHRVLDLVAVGEPGIDRHGLPKPLVASVYGGFGLTFGREGRTTWNARDVFGTTVTLTTPTPIPATDDGPPFVLALAAIYADTHPGARVVLLRNGREVES